MTLSTILLVEDDEDDFHLTSSLVKAIGAGTVAIDWVPNYHRGLSSLIDKEYDAALIDYRLGVENGVDLLRSARAQGCTTPLIMLTGESESRVDADALAAGADDYLIKGEVNATLLERSLRYAMERRRDAAERRRIELALTRSEADYRSTFESAPIGMAHTRLDGSWLRANERLRRLLGYSEEQLRSPEFPSITHPDDAASNTDERVQLLAGTISSYSVEKRYRRSDGDYVWVNLTVSLNRDNGGEPRHFIATVEDISARKHAQQELAHIFELSPDMICTANYDGFFTRTNPAFSKTLGYTAEELQKSRFLGFVHDDDQAATASQLNRLATGETTFGFTNRYRTAAGAYRWIEWHARADADTQLIHAVARDQTDKRLLEDQLRQAQKMEAVGRLAGGVAHDFNNLLTAILGFADLAMEDMAAGDPRRSDIGQIVQAGKSATALTRQLLAFSRKQILAPQVIDLNTLVTGMRPLLRRLIGEDVELRTALDAAVLRINADPGQVEQVIMNLSVNARDAMPMGGVLQISTDMVELDKAFVFTHPGAVLGHHVRLTISDAGVGMSPDVLRHLFEPFFTTKEQGKGTGLGLATVYGIVQQSGGCITVTSAEGQGTVFGVHFPSVETAAPAALPEGLLPTAMTGSETILLVEDQREVRKVITAVLGRQGYTVLEAADGSAALALLRGRREPVDLLLTDVVMPGMSGRELVARLSDRDHSMRVLYMSGYTNDEILKHGVLDPRFDFLHKPFQSKQLLVRVRAALDRPRPGNAP